ncbi:restriction endonuclease subunit S [Pseudomonas sp. PDM11]|uniref:restriction endonuclease subunit S n=1 Tax=Pseudomonas sp. PDM11 TaxID=2769309 RepID=UPI0017812448|nr:restriction endonuclease subunit S [Pseudomonas sp. PDM11]MBD9396405.1 restriction endonuclease subunit S [Pseudomonas sp. PDM11]
MSELQKGWAAATLNDLIGAGGLFSDGDWIESKDQDPDGQNRLLQLADIGDGFFVDKSSRFVNDEKFSSLNCMEVKEGDVLIARMPDPLGRACLMPAIPQRCLTVVDVAVFRVGETGISNKWLMHFLNSSIVRLEIKLNSSGSTRKRISRGKLGEILLPVPPLAEQARIAAKLDELLVQVDTLKARIDAIPVLLKRFRQSVLASAVSGRLKEGGEGSVLPSGWLEVPLASVIDDLRYGTAQKCGYNGGAMGVLRIPNIGETGITLDDLKSSDFSELDRKKLSLHKGDIVLIRSNGSVELVGKSAVVSHKEEGLLFAGYLIRVRLDKEKVVPEYVNYWLKSPAIRQAIELTARSTSGVNNINSEEIRSLTFTMPPVSEQTEIVRRVEQLFTFADQLEAKVTLAKSRIDFLTQSILAKAFRGELVPQDPNDEPASVLLERIKAQRADAPKARRGRKASV